MGFGFEPGGWSQGGLVGAGLCLSHLGGVQGGGGGVILGFEPGWVVGGSGFGVSHMVLARV